MSAILAILEALEKQNKGLKAAEDNKSLLSALMDTNEYESKRQPSSRASYDTSTTGNIGMLGGLSDFAKSAGEQGLTSALKDTATDYAKSLDPTQELQEFIKKTKSGNTPTEKDVRPDSPRTGFLQQLGHALIGKDDTPGEANKNVWGYAGESIGDFIRGQFGLNTTGQRTTQSPTETYLSQIRDSLTTVDPIEQERMNDPLRDKSIVNTLNSPNNAFNEFRLSGGIPTAEYSSMEGSIAGRLFGQTPGSKIEQGLSKEVGSSSITRKSKEVEELSKKFGDVGRMVGAFRNLVGQYKRADEEFGGTGAKAAITHDLARLRYAPDSIKEKAASLLPAEAQRKEVTIAMLPFLSGQARYVESLAKAIGETVPDVSVIPETRKDLIAQSVRNMMTLSFGIKNGFLTAEKLSSMGIDPDSNVRNRDEAQAILSGIKLNEEQEAAIDEAISYVLEKESIKGEKEKEDFSKMSDEELRAIIGGK